MSGFLEGYRGVDKFWNKKIALGMLRCELNDNLKKQSKKNVNKKGWMVIYKYF